MIVNVIAVRDAAVEQIKNAFNKKGFYIAPHPGRFSESDIRAAAQKTPAILTSITRIRESDDTVDFASFILYRATNVDKLYNGAASIAAKLIAVLKELEHELCLDEPNEISAECLFSGSLDSINITLWAVSWSWELQPYAVSGGIESLDDLEFFEGYEACHNVGDSVVNDNVDIETE